MAENKDFNIVSSEESAKTIDREPKIDPPVKAPKLRAQQYDVLPGSGPSAADRLARDKNYHVGIDPTKYANEYNKGTVILGSQGVAGLNESRAAQQGWMEQARNMIGQAVVGEVIGGTIEGFGYLGEVGSAMDYLDGTEKKWGNWMTELGKDTREFAQENMAIHQRNDSGMGDSGWWFSNGVSVASSLSMLIPTGAATKALGMLGKFASKGAGVISRSLDVATKMGKYERWMAEGITQAIVSRHIENSMEASGVFNEQKKSLLNRVNPKTGATFTEEEATQLASHGASSTYRSDWAMLLQDIPQYLALGKVFNPISMKMESKLAEVVSTGAKPGLKSALTAGAGTFLSEGAEESYQYYVAERGKLLSDLKAGLITEKEYDTKTNEKIGDKEMLTSAFWGGLGGNIFQAAGQGTSELFKSKERRTNEANYASIQGDYIAKRGASFKVMQEEIAKADQTGDPVKRQAAIDGSGVQMAIDAIDNQKFPEYIESLQSLNKMSPDEQAGFEQQMGIELSPDLFAKYVPSLIEQAHKLRASYLKHANKYDSNIAAKMASNDHYVKAFDNRAKEVTKEIQTIKDSVPNAGKLTSYYKDKFSTRANLISLKKANDVHVAAIANTESGYKKENRQALIDKNKKLIDKLSLKMTELNSNDPRTKDEKDSDKLIGAGFEESSGELILKGTESTLLNDAINLMQKENVKIQSKAYQAELRHTQKINQVNRLSTVDQAEQAKIDVNENESNSKEKKEELTALIDARIEAIKKEEKNKAAKATQEENNARLEKERIAAGLANPVAVPNTNMTPVGSNLEDEFATEEVDISAEMTEKSDKAKRVILDSQLNIGAPHIMENTIQGRNYKEWMLNGKDKLRTPVAVRASEGNYPGGTPANVARAIEYFNNGVVDANVIDYLPLVATFGGSENDKNSDKKEAYLGSKVATKTQLHAELWEKDREVRKAIIEEISKTKSAFNTIVAAQYGGKVNAAPAIEGVIPENNIGDFMHLAPVLDEMFDLNGAQATPYQIALALEPALMYTNEFGDLMTLDRERHPDYLGKSMSLPLLTGSTSARVPMRGTVFLNVPKADGTNFPLKLNVKKHSQAEAEVIADLLTSIIKKENKFETPLSQMADEYKLKIMETMKTELDAMEKADPSLMEIVDFFTYVSPQTEGKASELFINGEWIKFGNAGLKVTPKALFNHEKLVEFLLNTKRRQFNIALWNSSPAYKDYVIASGLINTDAVVDGPLFGGNTGIYLKAPAGTKPLLVNPAKMLQHTPTVQGEKPRSERRRMSEKAGVYSDRSTNGKFAATYYGKDNVGVEILRDTEALAAQAVTDKYNAETSTGPATKTVVATQPAPSKKQDDMSNLPTQDTNDIKVVIKKDAKSNFNLVIKDGGIVMNENTGKELDPKKDAKLINKALLKSGLLKYEKITVGNQVYAATAMNTIINITPGSQSNGNTILSTSAIGSKVMAQYTGKFTGKVAEVGAEEISQEELNATAYEAEVEASRNPEEEIEKELRYVADGSITRAQFLDRNYGAEKDPKVAEALNAAEIKGIEASKEKEAAFNLKSQDEKELSLIEDSLMKIEIARYEPTVYYIQSIALGLGIPMPKETKGGLIRAFSLSGGTEFDDIHSWLDKAELIGREKIAERNSESPKVSDPRMLLMGMNSVDLSNETAIKQEQADISSLDSINASTNVFDMALEADLDPVIPVPKKAPEPTSHFNENDSVDEITNLFEDEYGCGFM